MTKSEVKRDPFPRIAEFYQGKSVLITGAAGFVGMIVLEILLRNCPGIESIYILLREKKGLKVEARKEILFKKTVEDLEHSYSRAFCAWRSVFGEDFQQLFHTLKDEKPEVFDKVHVVQGDVVLPDLGLSEEDLQKIIPSVTIVYHCAADISFLKPLKFLMENNAYGTHNVVNLCKKLKKIEVLLYTSTICSNCNRNVEILEEVYRLPFPSKKFLDEIKYGTNETLEALVSQCQPPWPNSYTFSKCLAENILLENAAEVPFSVIRPSLVCSVWKKPLPGFAEKNSALVLICVGGGKGFIKILLVDPDNLMDFVPADVVANAHVVASWKVATQRSPNPLIVNCTSYGTTNYTWSDITRSLLALATRNPMPNTFRKSIGVQLVKTTTEYKILSFYEHYVPAYVIDFLLKISGKKEKGGQLVKTTTEYKILAFYEHYVPAYVIDFLLKISGKKKKLVPLYHLFDKAMFTGKFFVTGRWKFAINNFKALEDNLVEEEKQTFFTDFSDLNMDEYVNHLPTGNEVFDWKKDKRTLEARMKIAGQRYMLSCFIKYSFLLIVFTTLYLVISKVGRLMSVF